MLMWNNAKAAILRPESLGDHPSRQEVLGELHARPVEAVHSPASVRRVALLLDQAPEAAATAMREFAAWCAQSGIQHPNSEARYHRYQVGDLLVTWELHTEFVTFTWVSSSEHQDIWPANIGLEAISHRGLMAATTIDILSATSMCQPRLDRYQKASLCFSEIENGDAQVATDFRADENGFTRFTIAARANLDEQRIGAIVRRLLEIETYRTFALLGLPLARRISPELTKLEVELGQLVEEMGDDGSEDDARQQLARLHALTLHLNKTIERTSYRFSASRAYGEILNRRLTRLGEKSTAKFSTLERYLANRIEPALATCIAVEKRQTDLGQKLERVTEFLNTRIGLKVQLQNMQVMDKISKTSFSQYQLQKTVEGLSVIAISYYAIGILAYILSGIAELSHFSKPLVIAIAAPLVVGAVWLGMKRITKQNHK